MAEKRTPTVEVFQEPTTREWYYFVVAANGRTIAQSEGHSTKSSAERSVKILQAICAMDEIEIEYVELERMSPVPE